jgi:hypothetical protein
MPDFPLAIFGDDLVDALYIAPSPTRRQDVSAYSLMKATPCQAPGDIKKMTLEAPSGFVTLVYIDLDSIASVNIPAAVTVSRRGV